MSITKLNAVPTSPEKYNLRRQKFGAILSSDHSIQDDQYSHDTSSRINTDSSISSSDNSSPYSSITMPPLSESSSYAKSPWTHRPRDSSFAVDEDGDSIEDMKTKHGLIGSLFNEEGHVHSLATTGNLLLTGSESKNIRVWKDLKEFSGFKSSSRFVKAIVVLGDQIFTGHEDGKIRVWRFQGNKYGRVGTLPTTWDSLVKSANPRNYIQRTVPCVKHDDAVSCMSIDADLGLLYSGSWDKTMKVWGTWDFKCLESINAHEDSVNSVVVGFDGLVFTGSADRSVKAWRRELVGKRVKHVLVETLLKHDETVTSLVVNHTTLYAGTSDGLVSFWEREKHSMIYSGVLRGHKLAVLCLATGGNLVMSGSADKSICVWRRQVGGVHACVAVLAGHRGPVKCLAVETEEEEGDGHCIVYSGSLDKSVKVWRGSQFAPNLKDVHE